MEYANPKNLEATARLAHAMYEHVARAGVGGLPFADVAAAVAMVNGMFLAGAYRDRPTREIAARNMAKAAVEQARRLENVPRAPFGTTPAVST